VIPPQSNADFAAAMEQVLDVYRRPYDHCRAYPGGNRQGDPPRRPSRRSEIAAAERCSDH